MIMSSYICIEIELGCCDYIYLYVPSVDDGDDSGFVLGNAEKDGLREVEVEVGRVTPAPRRAEIGGRHYNGPRQAPLRVVGAPKLEACTAA